MGETLAATRRSLHGVAELVIAGPQFRTLGSIELRVRAGGFGGHLGQVGVEGSDLVSPTVRVPLAGTCRELATAVGTTPADLHDVYADGSGVDPDEPLTFDPDAVRLLLDWLALGDAALRVLEPDREPVLWPEHFDVALDRERITYGVSPGDADRPAPYAYVGPWDTHAGPFWNASFGAARPAADLPGVTELVAFFDTGRQQAADGSTSG